jgi:hypothetical protein
MIFAAVKTNANNIRRTVVLGRSAYFLNKRSWKFNWSNEYINKYLLVEMVEFQPLGDL